jgi:hypothetical protein
MPTGCGIPTISIERTSKAGRTNHVVKKRPGRCLNLRLEPPDGDL